MTDELKGAPYKTITIVTVSDTMATAVKNNNVRYAIQSKGKRRREENGARWFIIGVVKFPMMRV
jgi:hypothetical protein